MEPVYIAAIVAFSGLIAAGSPVLLAYLTNRNRREEKKEDYARQDQVAAQAAEAARLLVERQDAAAAKAAEAANLLLAANERVAQTAVVTNGKLDVIHTLVNSNYTSALQSELSTMKRELVLLLSVIDLKKAAGQSSNGDAANEIASTRAKIAELEATLADRLKQTKIIEKQQEELASRPLPPPPV
jgi:hypothetical protein